MKNIIIIAPHPDDETLGVGGTILKHKANGDKVSWLIVTAMNHGFAQDKIVARNEEIKKVAQIYGFDEVYNLEYSPATINGNDLPGMIGKISAIFNQFQPQTIYLPNRSDPHSDHRVIFDAVMACTKSFRYNFIEKILMYETVSETEFAPALAENVFVPNYFIDISNFLEKKLEIMKIYKSEIGEHPFPRSLENIKALAHFRGASCGVKYAESFQLLKFIDK